VARCPKCGTDSPDQARFCRACGDPLPGRAGIFTPPAALSAEERARRLLEDAFRLSEEGRVLAAIQACQQAIAINPNSTSAHSLLGTLYERQGDRDNAIREYEQVLTLSPGSTVERRRLNELMGVPAAREALGVSPRAARLAVTGGAAVVVMILVVAIFSTVQRGAPPAGGPAPPTRALAASEAAAIAGPAEFVPSPGSVYGFSSPPAARMPASGVAAQRPISRGFGGQGGAQFLAPGTYLLPATGGQRPAAAAPPPAPAPPFEGAELVGGIQQPPVRLPTGGPAPAGAPLGAGASPQLARGYYFQGNYQRAIEAYQAYLAQNPGAGAAPREELAWVYTEAGDAQRATRAYRSALGSYQEDLARGHNVEAARHGVRTCESALKALESP